MKSAEALKDHDYLGKQRKKGDVYYIRRTDIPLMEKLGRIKIVPDPNEERVPSLYHTTTMDTETEQPRQKRKYTRRKVVETVEAPREVEE